MIIGVTLLGTLVDLVLDLTEFGVKEILFLTRNINVLIIYNHMGFAISSFIIKFVVGCSMQLFHATFYCNVRRSSTFCRVSHW